MCCFHLNIKYKLTISKNEGGVAQDNGDWFQLFNGASFNFEAGVDGKLSMSWYQDKATITVLNNDVAVAANDDGSFFTSAKSF